ncbi:substrate-binding and VWA domain-containing protein [Streptomyces sp. NPDC052225]|uniref:substrate-binding and VWA domain-containing protein n=1 Tax=Streptomyces sp. NPDC052225 TaxID=3154949 RepID=UPI0034414436
MGRHSSMPDEYGAPPGGPRPRSRGRVVAVATALVLAVAAGTAFAVRSDLLDLGGTCEDEVELDVVASPDIAPALRDAAAQARRDQITSDGNCLDVTVTARDAYKVADTLRTTEGDPGFQAWVPDSSVWLQRVGQNAKAAEVTAAGNVASSPIGVGMVPSAAKSFGWPDKTYGWTQLTGAALQADQLRLGAADPARSATGLLALTKLASAAQKSGDKDGTQAAALAKVLSQRMSDSDSQLMDTVARDTSGTEEGNPRRNEALILSEQAAFTHNADVGDAGALDLFYPKDGSPALDYPFTLVDESGLTTDESRAAVRFMTLLSAPEGRSILEKHGFRTDGGASPEAVAAQAGGRTPQPYAEPTSEPATDEQVEETLGMWTITVQSARITTVVDASASMSNPVPSGESRMDVTKASMLAALSTFTPEDEIGLWEFSTHLDGERDYKKLVPTQRLGDRKGSGTVRDRLSAAFTGLQPVPGGATGLYDTTLAAYKEATASYKDGKFNAVVVVTDGVNEDPGSISRSSLISQLEDLSDTEHPVPLIAIAVGPDTDKDEIEQIAEATGGSGHQVSDPADIQKVILKAIIEAGAKTS